MAIDLASILKQIARDGSQGASGNSFFYLLDGADIDFKVSGFIVNSGLSGGGSVDNTLGNKYIVLDESGLTTAGIESSIRSVGIANNDIIEKRSTYWGIHSDASLTGNAKGASGGALAYVVPQQSFYFYDSIAWKKFGSSEGSFNILDQSGNSDQVDLNSTLTFTGGAGMSVVASDNKLTFNSIINGATNGGYFEYGTTGSWSFKKNSSFVARPANAENSKPESFVVGNNGTIEDLYVSLPGNRVNLIKHSQDWLTPPWNRYAGKEVVDQINTDVGWPLGGTGGIKVVFDDGDGDPVGAAWGNGIYQLFFDTTTNGPVTGQEYTLSCWTQRAPENGDHDLKIRLSYYSASVDGSIHSQPIPVGNTPERVSFSFVSIDGNPASNVAIGNDHPEGQAGAGSTGAVYLWGIQLERGTEPTNYIRTFGATASASAKSVRVSSSFYGLTGVTSGFYPAGLSSSGITGDRLILATGPTNDPFRNYVRFGNAWVQTGVVGIGQGPVGPTGAAGTAGDAGIAGTTGSGYTGAYLMPDGTLQVTFADWSSGSLVQTAVNLGTVKGETGAIGATGAAGATGGRGFPFEYLQQDDAPFSGYENDGGGLHLRFKPEFMSAAQLLFVSRIFDEVLERAGGNELTQITNSGISISLFNPLMVGGVETARFNVSSVAKTWQDYGGEAEDFNAFRFYGTFEIGSTGAIQALNGSKFQVESNILPRKNSKSGFAYRYGLTGTATNNMEPGNNGVNTGWVAPFNNNATYIAISNEDDDGKSLTGVFADWATIGKGILTIDADEPYRSSQGRIVYDVNHIVQTTAQSSFSRFHGTIISGTTGSIPWYQTSSGSGSQPRSYAYRVRVNFIPDGATGARGATGATGTVSLTGYDPYSGLTHSNTSFDSYSGVRGRKYMYMTEDGGITWDYIRPQDIYNATDFLFNTLTFSASNFPSVRRLSPNNYSLSATTFSTTYRIGSPANSGGQTAQIAVSNSEGSGFPLFSSNDSSTEFSAAACSLSGNPDASSNTGRQVVFTLTATGQDFDGDISPSAPRTLAVSLRNDFLYGLTNANFLTGGVGNNGLDWVSTRNKNGLSADYGLLGGSPLTETVAGFNKTVTTAETGVNGDYYIYIAYPRRLHSDGTLVARLGSSTDPVGGMKLQGPELQDIADGVSTIQYTNEQGFVEQYKIWRSEQRFSAAAKPSFYISLVSS